MSMLIRDLSALRSYVQLMGLSQRALAVRAGVAPATVNHLMSGRRHGCSRHTAAAIETALQCPTGLFFAPSRRELSHAPAVLATGDLHR